MREVYEVKKERKKNVANVIERDRGKMHQSRKTQGFIILNVNSALASQVYEFLCHVD